MSKKFSAVLTLCMSAICLSGCSLLRVAGPCYGVGCPSGTEGHNAQYKPGEPAKTQNASIPAQAAPAQTASTSAQPAAAQSPATQSSVAESASAQPTATTAANAEAKPSPLHAIGDFFAHLIPHHSSDAKSGAAD
jgi:hypothetical protein